MTDFEKGILREIEGILRLSLDAENIIKLKSGELLLTQCFIYEALICDYAITNIIPRIHEKIKENGELIGYKDGDGISCWIENNNELHCLFGLYKDNKESAELEIVIKMYVNDDCEDLIRYRIKVKDKDTEKWSVIH